MLTTTENTRGSLPMEAKLDMVLEQVGRDKNIDKTVRSARSSRPS
jgi:hypothetical protein